MTSELEQEFYDAFGIEPYFRYLLVDTQSTNKKEHLFDKTELIDFCKTHKEFVLLKVDKKYPEITDHKLLEMICIKSKDNNGYRISANNHKSLKEEILKDLIKAYSTYIMCTWEEERGEKLKHQIQQLFKD